MTIEQRLEKLERTVRRYQLAFGILGLALLATTAIACSQQALAAQNNAAIPEVIRARKFQVVARNGKPIVNIGSAKRPGGEIGGIAGFTDKSVPIWFVSANDLGGGTMSLTDGKRRGTKLPPSSVYISANPKIGGYMTVNNGLDKQVVYIGTGISAEVIRARKFEVVARNGKPIVRIGSAKRPGGEIGKIDGWTDKSVPIWSVSANDLGGGTMSLTDGKRRGTKLPPISVLISANPKIGGYMTVNNGLDKQVVYIGTGTGFQIHCGFLTLGDANGDYSFSRNGSDN